jgi:protein CpxP
MRAWIRRTLIGVFGATVLLGGLTACGHQRGHAWNASPEQQAKHREHLLDRVSSKLDLSAEQKQKLNVLADKLTEQRNALRGKAGNSRDEVRALIAGDKFDRAKAQALVGQKTEAVQGKSPEVIAALGDFYDSLQPVQQAKVREFLERGGRHWWRRG